MKKNILLSYLVLLCFVCCRNPELPELEKPVVDVSFNQESIGTFDRNDIKRLFPNVLWAETHDRGEIVEDEERGNVLQVKYPKGSIGPKQGGIEFVVTLPSNKEYYLDYYIKFDSNFDFQKGGKLLGLASDNGLFSGGKIPTEEEGGWSSRTMFGDGRNPFTHYLYYVDMKTVWGESVYFNSPVFERDRWYRITHYVRLNDVNRKNALVRIWVNERLAFEKKGFRLRSGNKGILDTFTFVTFHGGNTIDFAPDNDSYAFFDNIRITKKKPF